MVVTPRGQGLAIGRERHALPSPRHGSEGRVLSRCCAHRPRRDGWPDATHSV